MNDAQFWGLLVACGGAVFGWWARGLRDTDRAVRIWLALSYSQRQCPGEHLHGPHQWGGGTGAYKGFYECSGKEQS